MSLKKLLTVLLLALGAPVAILAQVTTGSITGNVKDSKGEFLVGATIKAVHQPTGTEYSTVTKSEGHYVLPNLRVGGPYTVTITYVGYSTQTYDNLVVTLGNPVSLQATMENSAAALSEVKITGKGNSIISSDRTGTSTNVSLRTISNLPTLSRSIQDYARLTPQAVSYTSNSSNSPVGISFAGQSNKYNQFTIDGANATDVFGLSSTGTNGGQAGANPIPIESIQELQIVLDPYDVTYGGFTGGGMNAVTKSGSNVEHGSAYYVFQNQGLVGNGANDTKYPSFKDYTFGASLGGKIIQNKLFYFINAERTDSKTPLAYDPSNPSSGSKFPLDSLQSISSFVNGTYGKNGITTGSYTGLTPEQSATSIFGRIDWNINEKNKLTIRHAFVHGSNYILSRSPTSMTFYNGGYDMINTSNSTVAELNSNFSSSSNVLRVTFNDINDHRTTQAFPSVTIYSGALTYNLGGDYSSARNSLIQKNYTLLDNYTIYRGTHTVTFGTDNEFYNTTNVFLQDFYGGYTYNSIADFENNATPAQYYVSYSTKGAADDAAAKMHAAQFSLYGGDVWAIKDNFKLTYGVRIDMPVFFNKPDKNSNFDTVTTFNGIQNSTTPKSTPLFSPRVAFNWDVHHNGKTQLRGGAGLFTGRIPFVWVSNMYTNTGVASIKYSGTTPGGFQYNPTDPHLGAYIPSSYASAPTEIDVTDPHFKFPQILRSNLAIDQKLGVWGLIGTLEGIYTKTINNINYQNLNVGPQVGEVTLGSTTRPWYNFKRANSSYTDVLELTNTSKGYAYNFTAQLQKPYSNGWQGMVAYTYGRSYSLNDGTSSTAISNWRYAYNINGLNNLDLSRANYDPGSRVIAYITKQFRYAHNRLATNVGLVYTGQSGETFSYMFSKNINGDDVSSKSANADLAYLPTDASQFATLTRNGAPVSAAQQFSDLQTFEAANHLTSHAGENLDRNAFRLPWENHFDLKLSEDIYVYKAHRLQVSFDVFDVNNLLSRKWGWSYYLANQDVNLFTVVTQTQTPTYTFDITKQNLIKGVYRPYTISDFNSRWRGQISLKYAF